MKKQEQGVVIEEIQQDPDRIIISNPLAVLKFNKQSGKGFIPVPTQEIGLFIPKIVWETISLLSNTDFENIEGDHIKKRIYIKDFLKRIRGDESNYRYVIDAARVLRAWEIASVNEQGQEVYRGFFNEVIHDKKTGYIDFKIAKEWASDLLDIAKNGNVSFLKQYLFDLQNSHAINLYPTLKAHCYKQKYVDTLDGFKTKFGYNTTGYRFFNNLKARVIEPAIEEINKKSDLIVYFEPDGTNLDGKKPRITGVIFWVKEKPKDKEKQQTKPQEEPSHISNKVKDIPFIEIPQQPKQPQPQSITTPPPTAPNMPSIAMIQELGEKVKITIEQVGTIMTHYNHDNIRTWEALEAISRDKTVKNVVSYAIGSTGLGVGLWKGQQIKIKQSQEKQLKGLLENIQNEYRQRRREQQIKLYEEASEAQKTMIYNLISEEPTNIINNRNIAIHQETKQLNSFGLEQAGEMLADAQKQGATYRQPKFRNFVFEKYNIQINFDNNDEVIY